MVKDGKDRQRLQTTKLKKLGWTIQDVQPVKYWVPLLLIEVLLCACESIQLITMINGLLNLTVKNILKGIFLRKWFLINTTVNRKRDSAIYNVCPTERVT